MQGPSIYSPVPTSVQVETSLSSPQPASQVKSDNANPISGAMLDGALLLLPLCFALTWAIVVLLVADVPKLSRESFSLKRAPRVPCRNCRYFNSNPYLKCTVHPTVALTEAATDCKDFQTQQMSATERGQ